MLLLCLAIVLSVYLCVYAVLTFNLQSCCLCNIMHGKIMYSYNFKGKLTGHTKTPQSYELLCLGELLIYMCIVKTSNCVFIKRYIKTRQCWVLPLNQHTSSQNHRGAPLLYAAFHCKDNSLASDEILWITALEYPTSSLFPEAYCSGSRFINRLKYSLDGAMCVF